MPSLKVSAICGAANNPLADPEIAHFLAKKGIMYVPDTIASAGAVVDGIGRTVMGLTNTDPLIERLGDVAEDVLRTSLEDQTSTQEIAQRLAWTRISSGQ